MNTLNLPLRAEPNDYDATPKDLLPWVVRNAQGFVVAFCPDKETAEALAAMSEDAKRLDFLQETRLHLLKPQDGYRAWLLCDYAAFGKDDREYEGASLRAVVDAARKDWQLCQTCNGKGRHKVMHAYTECSDCHGTGRKAIDKAALAAGGEKNL